MLKQFKETPSTHALDSRLRGNDTQGLKIFLGLFFGLFLGSLFLMLPFSPAAPKTDLPALVQTVLKIHFKQPTSYKNLADLEKRWPVAKTMERARGVFVTLSKSQKRGYPKTRACWGQVDPLAKDLVKATIAAAHGALTQEYRYPPIQAHEVADLKPQVTIIEQQIPINSYRELNPLRDGLLIRSGSKAGVLLPGETRDAHAMLVQCRLKAGIGEKSPQQLYKLVVTVFQ